jgi:peptidoglycan hydrolase-like protein with peptidoglycan-binding domain
MLRLLQDDSIGRSASPESVWPAAARAGHRYPGIGDDSNEVRRLQRALRRAGHDVSIDGRYGSRTWLAVRSAQEAAGLEADGVIGPRTWAALPVVSAPLLRPGSAGDDVAALQRVLTQHAPGRWDVCPEGITGTFDTSTSAAVLAFQQWSHLTADGIVGDHTWNAPVDDSGTSLEVAVGREHSPHDPR